MNYTPLVLLALNMFGILIHNLMKMDEINKKSNGNFKLMQYLKLERFSIAVSICFGIVCVIASQEIKQLEQVGKWLGLALDAIGSYQHITCVYNGSTMTVRINAVNPNSTNVTGTVTSSNSWVYYLGSAGECPNGKMANFRIYNRALTATEISQNYNAELNRFK